MPTRIVMGQGSIRNIPEIVSTFGVSRVLMVTDSGLEKAGVVEAVVRELRLANCAFILFSGVGPNPTIEMVALAYRLYCENKCEGVLAVGGGSSIDTGKAVSLLATNGGEIQSYRGADIFKNHPSPLFVVPTTIGSGSEVTFASVITDRKIKKKLVVRGSRLFPRVAILDPELLQSLPPKIAAATGMDALTHAIEGYVSLSGNPITDGLHRQAIRLINENLRAAVANNKDLEANGNMLLASTITGIGFTNSSLGLVHAMSHPVSAQFDVPHGEANAIILPEVMRFNLISNIKKFAEICVILGGSWEPDIFRLAKMSVDRVRELALDVDIPPNLRDLGVPADAARILAEEAIQEAFNRTNPRPASLENIHEIYKRVI